MVALTDSLFAEARNEQVDVACSHCGLEVPLGRIALETTEQFCCAGCQVVYTAIRAHGLDRYYCMQAASPGAPTPARLSGRNYLELDNAEFLDSYALRLGANLRSIEFFLEGVHCSACIWLVEKLARVAPGVVESRLDLGRTLVRVVWDERTTQLSRVAQALDSLGYPPHVGRDVKSRELRQLDNRKLLIKIALAGAGAGNVMLLAFALYGGSFHGMEGQYSALFRWMSLVIGLVVLLGPGSLFFRGAIAALRTRTAHLDLPIAIGLGAGTIAGTINTVSGQGEIYFDSLTGLVFFLLVGRYIQRRLEQRATDTVERLFSLTPSYARLRQGDTVREVPIEALELGQLVEVLAGGSFPADGRVVEGESSVDLSLLTGESRPVTVVAGDNVFAGALNVARPLTAQISALGRDTRVGKLLCLMQDCAQRKAPIVQLADRFAGYFTVASLVLFVGTYFGWRLLDSRHALDHAVTLLIVSCPCGLGLATPFAVSVALGRAARASILVKGGEVLEKLISAPAHRSSVFLDKTGTLTDPGLRLIEWHGASNQRPRLEAEIAALESKVNHPVARALSHLQPTDAAHLPLSTELLQASGNGVEGKVDGRHLHIGSEAFVVAALSDKHTINTGSFFPQWATDASQATSKRGNTPVWVAVDGSLAAIIGVGSEIRSDAKSTIAALQGRGFRVAILSGDDPTAVRMVGAQLGLDEMQCHGGLTPEGKVQFVEAAAGHGPVIMVGDGVNDAAALSAANVGLAVRGGAEASLTAADAYLGRPGVGVIVELLDGAARTMSVIRRCLWDTTS